MVVRVLHLRRHRRADRVERVEEEMWIELRLQGRHLSVAGEGNQFSLPLGLRVQRLHVPNHVKGAKLQYVQQGRNEYVPLPEPGRQPRQPENRQEVVVSSEGDADEYRAGDSVRGEESRPVGRIEDPNREPPDRKRDHAHDGIVQSNPPGDVRPPILLGQPDRDRIEAPNHEVAQNGQPQPARRDLRPVRWLRA